MEDSYEEADSTHELIAGLSIIIIATIYLLLYCPMMFIFFKEPEYQKSRAYKIMACIGVTDILQLCIHIYSGILVTTHIDELKGSLNKIMGALLTGLWYSMLMLTIFLNVNRFCDVILYRYSEDRWMEIFNGLSYIICFATFLLTFVLKLFPDNNYLFLIKYLYWGPLSSDGSISKFMLQAGKYLVLVVVFSSIITYASIFSYIFLQQTAPKVSKREMKITVQVLLGIIYFLFSYVYWNYIMSWFPEKYIFNYISQMVWVIMNGIHPIIYLIFNTRLRTSFRKIWAALLGIESHWVVTSNRKSIVIVNHHTRASSQFS